METFVHVWKEKQRFYMGIATQWYTLVRWWSVVQQYCGVVSLSWIGLYLIRHNKQQLAHAPHADITALFNRLHICFNKWILQPSLCINAICNDMLNCVLVKWPVWHHCRFYNKIFEKKINSDSFVGIRRVFKAWSRKFCEDCDVVIYALNAYAIWWLVWSECLTIFLFVL